MIFLYKIEINEELRKAFGDWKFEFYDSNNNGLIEAIESNTFKQEIVKLVKVKTFQTQLDEVIDTDKDGKYSKVEWKTFISLEAIGNKHVSN